MSSTELKIDYDKSMRPVSAICKACDERMAQPPADLQNSADIIMWLSKDIESIESSSTAKRTKEVDFLNG